MQTWQDDQNLGSCSAVMSPSLPVGHLNKAAGIMCKNREVAFVTKKGKLRLGMRTQGSAASFLIDMDPWCLH